MIDVYESIPVLTSEHYLLRGLQPGDAPALLPVYSDEQAVPFFNGDNCHGDDFHYATLARMQQAVDFWLMSYRERYFVRWVILERDSGSAIGTIELFHRDDALPEYDDAGLLRLDLRSDREHAPVIAELLTLLHAHVFALFHCSRIVTKVRDFAAERLSAVWQLGYVRPSRPLTIAPELICDDYYVRQAPEALRPAP